MKIAVIVPVSPFEPERIILRSANHLIRITENLDAEIIYVIDDERMKKILSSFPVKVFCRNTSKGKRAGALNYAIQRVDADFIAIFDVDCLPEREFIEKCVEVLKSDESVAIASGCRKVLNEEDSLITKIISSEYAFFCDIYRLMNHFRSFIHFNGLIGVLRAEALKDKEFNEKVLCEDIEMMNRLVLEGYRAGLVNSKIKEEAPITLRDLINQRIRWCAGSLESLRFSREILKSPHSISFKLSWFATILSPFYSFLLSFLVPLYLWRLTRISKDWKDLLLRFFGLFVYGWIISFCAFIALFKKLFRRRIEWKALKRSE